MGLNKITIRRNNTKVSMSAKGETLDELCEKALKVFGAVYDQKEPEKHEVNIVPQIKKETDGIADKQKWTTRTTNDRLPNIVNLDDFNIQNAETEMARIRCPHCGQAFCGIAHNTLMARDVTDKDSSFEYVSDVESEEDYESIRFNAAVGMNIRDYYDDLIKAISKDTIDIVIESDTKILCPVCSKANRAEEWNKAWKEPEKYFGLNDICNICGGEVEHYFDQKGSHDKCVVCGFEY